MAASTTFHVRLPLALKKKAQKIAERNGIDLPTAVRIFFVQMTNTGTMPTRWLTENNMTPEAEAELLALSKDTKNMTGPMTPDEAVRYCRSL
ncbi:MAG: hypothetical protein V1926_05140 [Candidatus Peregrinibacteria bacterium]